MPSSHTALGDKRSRKRHMTPQEYSRVMHGETQKNITAVALRLQEYRISIITIAVLYTIHINQRWTSNEISDATGLTKEKVRGSVEYLVEIGLVENVAVSGQEGRYQSTPKTYVMLNRPD